MVNTVAHVPHRSAHGFHHCSATHLRMGLIEHPLDPAWAPIRAQPVSTTPLPSEWFCVSHELELVAALGVRGTLNRVLAAVLVVKSQHAPLLDAGSTTEW